MAYTPNFTPTYENGWEDLPSESTPITADALNNYDEAIEYIEDYLEQGGGGGADTSIIAEEYDESESYSEGQYVIYEDKLYKCVTDTFGGEFDPSDWSEVTVSSEMYSEFSTINNALGRRVPVDNVGYVNSDLNRAEKAYTQGEIFYMGYGQRVAVALTNISLGDSLVLHTNYEYTTLSEQIANAGGGGGGSTVTITPTISTGTKIADYSINGVSGELYAPTGGGGSSTLAGLSDVNLSSPTDGQVLKYDATNDEWVNANESGGGSSALDYSTTEKKVGTWIDGSDIYQISYELTSAVTLGTGWTGSGIFDVSNVDKPIKGELVRWTGSDYNSYLVGVRHITSGFSFNTTQSNISCQPGSVFTVWYTKTS